MKSKYSADITMTNMLGSSRAQNALRKAADREGIQVIFYRTSKPVPVNIFVNERDDGARVYVNIDSEVPSLVEVERTAGRSGEEEGIVSEAGERYNERAGDVVADNVPKTRVGQWMSKTEYEQFLKTGEIPRTNVLTNGMNGYIKQANKGDYYVEFDIDSSLLVPKNEALGWSLIKPKNQMYIRLYQNRGLPLQDPIGTNITHVYTK